MTEDEDFGEFEMVEKRDEVARDGERGESFEILRRVLFRQGNRGKMKGVSAMYD